ncbi:MAG: response regulator [Thermoanaerobaculia bacterium]
MTKTILLADDSSNIHRVVELTFLGDDFQLETVLRGDEALEKFSEISPDIVIADVHMPGVSGYEVCRQVKAASPSTPVLLMVGALESFDEEEMSACGADNYLKKPFDSELLLQEVKRLTASSAEVTETETSTRDPQPEVGGASPDLRRVKIGSPDPFHLKARASAQSIGLEPATSSSSAGKGVQGAVLPEQAVEAIVQRVIERLSDQAVREIAWELVPDLAEVVIRDRLQELESEVE